MTLTNDQDEILENIKTGSYLVLYTGQNKGLQDSILREGVEKKKYFKVYYRKSSNDDFIYLGESKKTKIVRDRRRKEGENTVKKERLKIRIRVEKKDVVKETIKGKKKGVTDLFGFKNIQIGFYLLKNRNKS